MDLTFTYNKIKDWQQRCIVDTGEVDTDGMPVYALDPILDVLPYLAQIVGMRSLTTRNLDEFHRRYTIIEAVRGPFFLADDRLFCLTRHAIGEFIGLTCNVRAKTRREFDTIWLSRAISALVPLRLGEIVQLDSTERRRRVPSRTTSDGTGTAGHSISL